MQKSIAFVLVFVPVFMYAQSWTTLNVNVASNVQRLSFPTDDTGYVSLENGQIRKTVDGALTWTSCNLNTGFDVDLEFISGTTGFVADGSVLRKTTDGGQNWTASITNANVSFYDIFFLNNSVGYVTAINATPDSIYIYTTSNGGNSWSLLPIVSGPYNPFYPEIFFTNPLVGFVMAESYILKTVDGGLTWTNEYTVPSWDAVYSFSSPDGVNVFGGCWAAEFVSSNDAGDNWSSVQSTNYPGLGIHFTSATHGYYCGGDGISSGAIEETNNGGVSWTPVHTGNSFYCMDWPSSATAYVGGTNGVIVKYSGPTSVEEQSVPSMVCYPNPATDVLTLENLQIGETVTLFDMTGQVVREFVATNTRMQLSVAELASGVYLVGSAMSTRKQKVVVEH